MVSRFIFNETSYFGWGAREALVSELIKRKYKRALVVTDNNLVDVAKKITDMLEVVGIEFHMFKDIVPNPTVDNVKKGLKIANKYHVDFIVAVGGGSVVDVAKAIGIISTNPDYNDVVSLAGVVNTDNKSLPIIAIPTTAGTAAEVTINYVITDKERNVKLVCVDPHDIPILSIVDTELMAGMPVSVAASTGMDALTHAMECYITKNHNDMSDMFALKAINLIYHNLEKAVNKDKEAMDKMALGQYIAGMGFSNVGLGIVHSMSHQLGAMYDTPHGVANAILLPYVMKYNGEVCADRFVDMAKEMDLEVNKTNAVATVVEAIKELNSRLDIPEHIKEVGVLEKDIPLLAEKALNDPCTGGNPREMDIKEFEDLFKEAL